MDLTGKCSHSLHDLILNAFKGEIPDWIFQKQISTQKSKQTVHVVSEETGLIRIPGILCGSLQRLCWIRLISMHSYGLGCLHMV